MVTVQNMTPEALTSEIREYRGNITAVAGRFGVSRTTVYAYIKEHPELADVISEARETMLDHAESSLYRAVVNGEGWAVCFFLKTQGKKRGYLERVDLSGIVTHVHQNAAEAIREVFAGIPAGTPSLPN